MDLGLQSESGNKQQRSLKEPAEWLSGIKRTDRLSPMYTVCIYHGEDVWDGPRTLRDMMKFGDDAEGLSELFVDYSMRLFCMNEYKNFDMFHTEVREVFAALNKDSVRALSVLLKQPQIWEERDKYMSKNGNGEEYDMCLALRELKEEGRLEGYMEATSRVLALVSKMIEAGEVADVPRLSDSSFLEEMYEKYSL